MFLPRSPLAIIIPSLILIREFRFVSPFWVSIFAIIFCLGNWSFIWEISLADSANEIARYWNFRFWIFWRRFLSLMSSMKEVLGCFWIRFFAWIGEMYFVLSRIMDAPAWMSSGILFLDAGP